MQVCRSRSFWLEREPIFWSGSGSYSYSTHTHRTVNILFFETLSMTMSLWLRLWLWSWPWLWQWQWLWLWLRVAVGVGAGAGNLKNGRLRQPWLAGCQSYDFVCRTGLGRICIIWHDPVQFRLFKFSSVCSVLYQIPVHNTGVYTVWSMGG